MSNNFITYLLGGSSALFIIIVLAYFIIKNVMNKSSDLRKIQQLRKGTKEKKFSSDIAYQKLYIIYSKIFGISRYIRKLRRRLEIINLEDEYLIRGQAAKIVTRALLIIVPLTIAIIVITGHDIMLLSILLILEIFMIETIMGGMVDKIDNKILRQQVDFFAEIRHAYHEYNMVEEAIYEVSQNDELEISRQGEKIYDILVSDEPEAELEKYYDIAPNSYLKEFAGLSYLTKEYGDRLVDGASLYLKNLNNITQEMQLEILKRDKLDYVFQSLSVISAVPVLLIQPLKSWAISQFSFTAQFYDGKGGLIVQVLLVILTFLCYLLVRKVKDNGGMQNVVNAEKPWQAKLYNIPGIKIIVDLFIPKAGTAEERKIKNLMKEAASKSKIEWLYVNRIILSLVTFAVSFVMFIQLHNIAISYVYNTPTSNYDLIGTMSASDQKKASELTKQDNYFLDKFKKQNNLTVEDIKKELRNSSYYAKANNDALKSASERIYNKLQIVNKEYFKWFELLISLVFGVAAFYGPIGLLIFQKRMRQIEMEDEVMQFQTIIMMLMKIERVNVEIILEWIERYSNIFRGPITKCVNNYESGPWEALEELKNDVSYLPLVRIVESLQAAVEKIPIPDAFDELDTERTYYQEKRKESNERLIAKKGRIGKLIGFAPMVVLFVGYLIIPLVAIGMISMTQSFSSMSAMI